MGNEEVPGGGAAGSASAAASAGAATAALLGAGSGSGSGSGGGMGRAAAEEDARWRDSSDAVSRAWTAAGVATDAAQRRTAEAAEVEARTAGAAAGGSGAGGRGGNSQRQQHHGSPIPRAHHNHAYAAPSGPLGLVPEDSAREGNGRGSGATPTPTPPPPLPPLSNGSSQGGGGGGGANGSSAAPTGPALCLRPAVAVKRTPSGAAIAAAAAAAGGSGAAGTSASGGGGNGNGGANGLTSSLHYPRSHASSSAAEQTQQQQQAGSSDRGAALSAGAGDDAAADDRDDSAAAAGESGNNANGDGDGQASYAQNPPRLSDLRVLVAEDNAINMRVALGILARVGITRVTTAANGVEALECVAKVGGGAGPGGCNLSAAGDGGSSSAPGDNNSAAPASLDPLDASFDVVLTDLHMPRMGGLELARELRRRYPRAATALVAVTADAFEDTRRSCAASGFDGWLPKPFRVEEMTMRLGEAAALVGRRRGCAPFS